MSFQSRHVYTRDERTILEASFARQSHPNLIEKERLAKLLNCNIIQISNWFQNHRRGIKKQKKSAIPTVNSPMYQTSCVYHQPNCPFSMNNDNASYYYYSPPPQYTYSHETVYPQSMGFDSFVTYEQ